MTISPSPNPPSESTADAGYNLGDLKKKSRLVNKATVERVLFEKLQSSRVGTWEVERIALEMSIRRRHKGNFEKLKGISKLEQIRGYRNWEEVKDQLEIKMKYCKEEEDKQREEYKEMKRILKKRLAKAGKLKKFQRAIRSITI